MQTKSQFDTRYKEVIDSDINQKINLTEDVFIYAYHCHEATLTFAYALHKTIAGMYLKHTMVQLGRSNLLRTQREQHTEHGSC